MNKKRSSQSVLLIIDMIEAFVNEGPLFDSIIRIVMPTLRRRVIQCVDYMQLVI